LTHNKFSSVNKTHKLGTNANYWTEEITNNIYLNKPGNERIGTQINYRKLQVQGTTSVSGLTRPSISIRIGGVGGGSSGSGLPSYIQVFGTGGSSCVGSGGTTNINGDNLWLW
jgi:hypothetical protein